MRLLRSARLLFLALLIGIVPASSYAGVFISINFGPPVLPVYVQPVCPQPNLIWTPGYWAYGEDGYFWVPGAWVPAPYPGGLWTPGYWGWNNALYIYHPGYWGYHVGYYGGVNYGGGYLGIGFAGGEWRGNTFAYNTAVVNVNTTVIHNTYINKTIIEQNTVVNPNHVAYSGGPGGVQHTATAQEQIAEHETHTAPTSFQTQHIAAAQTNKMSYAKANGGHPTTLAVAKPLAVETRTAPPAPRTAAITNGAKVGGAANLSRPATTMETTRPNTSLNPRPNTTTETRPTYTPRPNTTTETRPNTYTPPKGNPPPPKTNPKPAAKPKPDGHEK